MSSSIFKPYRAIPKCFLEKVGGVCKILKAHHRPANCISIFYIVFTQEVDLRNDSTSCVSSNSFLSLISNSRDLRLVT